MRKVIKPCSYGPNSVSVFDADRTNEYGEMYCVASGVMRDSDQANTQGSEFHWVSYVHSNTY